MGVFLKHKGQVLALKSMKKVYNTDLLTHYNSHSRMRIS